jgi:hypothetical protein
MLQSAFSEADETVERRVWSIEKRGALKILRDLLQTDGVE